jgi:hypothetical protein
LKSEPGARLCTTSFSSPRQTLLARDTIDQSNALEWLKDHLAFISVWGVSVASLRARPKSRR